VTDFGGLAADLNLRIHIKRSQHKLPLSPAAPDAKDRHLRMEDIPVQPCGAIAAIDLCVVPTLAFERLLPLLFWVTRRQLLWFAVTRHPTAEWLVQQIVEAFPWNTTPTYLVRDNDDAYGHNFTCRGQPCP
jgi:hypothetical protein